MASGGSTLASFGWDEHLAGGFTGFAAEGLVPGRVVVQHRASYRVQAADAELDALLAGRLRHRADTGDDLLPAVGDWVALRRSGGAGGQAAIQAVLPRRSAFVRKEAGRGGRDQVLAANVDIVFLMSSLNAELNLRRIERYLTLAWESGAQPVVVLAKADLCDDPEHVAARVRETAFGAPVHMVSSVDRRGLEELEPYFAGHRTVALLGSSGVGKSTLINALAGRDVQAVGAVRAGDDKGRHTTTRRELVLLPGGGLLLDTPGLRELQLTDAGDGLRETFDDLEALARECRFPDCGHASEPGCAVRGALGDGRLSAERLRSWQKLQRELAALDARKDRRAASETKRRARVAGKAMRARLKEKAG